MDITTRIIEIATEKNISPRRTKTSFGSYVAFPVGGTRQAPVQNADGSVSIIQLEQDPESESWHEDGAPQGYYYAVSQDEAAEYFQQALKSSDDLLAAREAMLARRRARQSR